MAVDSGMLGIHPPFLLRWLISSANSLSFSAPTSGLGLEMPLNFSAAGEDEWRPVIFAGHIFPSRRDASTPRRWTATPRVSNPIGHRQCVTRMPLENHKIHSAPRDPSPKNRVTAILPGNNLCYSRLAEVVSSNELVTIRIDPFDDSFKHHRARLSLEECTDHRQIFRGTSPSGMTSVSVASLLRNVNMYALSRGFELGS